MVKKYLKVSFKTKPIYYRVTMVKGQKKVFIPKGRFRKGQKVIVSRRRK